MMPATDFGKLHDRAELLRLDGLHIRRILVDGCESAVLEAGREKGAARGVQISEAVGRLCCSPDVSMMEATDFATRYDPARLRPFDGPHAGPSSAR
jgi:hypothetical protein